MSRLAVHAAAAAGVFRRDLAIFTSYRTRLFTTLFSTIVSLTLFYYVSRLVHSDKVGPPDAYYAFVVVGLSVFGVVTSTLSQPLATLRAELFVGTFERIVVSPFGAVRTIASLLLFPLTLALLTSVMSLTYASLAFGLELRFPDAFGAIPVVLLAALAFAPFGLLMAAAVVVFKQTNAGATFVTTAITLLAGVYFPVSVLPGWIRWASDVQPFTPAVDLARHLVVGTALPDSAVVDVVKLVVFPAVLLPVALWVLSTAITFSRRRGTIGEY